jgi:hypothetical protein
VSLRRLSHPWNPSVTPVLCFNINRDARLEFHGVAVGKGGDPRDELFDQSLIKICDVGFLPSFFM